MPHRLRCGGCHARLAFDANLLGITAVAALVLAAVVWLAQPLYAALATLGILPAAIIASTMGLSLWMLFEAALAWYLLKRRRMFLVDE